MSGLLIKVSIFLENRNHAHAIEFGATSIPREKEKRKEKKKKKSGKSATKRVRRSAFRLVQATFFPNGEATMKTERKRKLQKVWAAGGGGKAVASRVESNRTGEVDQEFSPGLFCGFDSHWPTASRYFPSFTPPKGIHSVCVCVCVSFVVLDASYVFHLRAIYSRKLFPTFGRSAGGVILGFFRQISSRVHLFLPPFCFLQVERRTFARALEYFREFNLKKKKNGNREQMSDF